MVRPIALTIFLVSAITTMGCALDAPDESVDVGASTVAPSTRCPTGNGFYVLYYGSSPADFQTIAAAKPNFVILGDGLEGRADLPTLFHGTGAHPTTLAFAYLPTGGGVGQVNSLDARLAVAIASKFDGIFFDEVNFNASTTNYYAHVAAVVHAAGMSVIMNPGQANVGTGIFAYADMVSVENQWNTPLNPSGVDAWRWLSVQGDPGTSQAPNDQPPSTGDEALSRLTTFRTRGGFWYYASTLRKAWMLPPWFATFATTVAGMANDSCAATTTPPPATTINTAGTGPYPLGIHTFNAATNAELSGLWTTVQTTSGQTLLSGFSPINYYLPAGSYQITTGNYKGPTTNYAFDHWDDHTATQPRPVTLTASPSGLWNGAWYDVTAL